MSDGEVIENKLSVYGLRWLHVVRLGEPIDAATWLARVPEFSRPLVEMHQAVEPGLGMHHLRMWWPAREPIAGGQQALLWRMEPGQSVRESAIAAGIAYLAYYGCWPNQVRISSLPAGATETIEIYRTPTEQKSARLVASDQVPAKFLILEVHHDN